MKSKVRASLIKMLLLFLIVFETGASSEFSCVAKAASASTKLNKSSVVLAVGKTYSLKATVTGSKKTVTWSSSNKAVATVNSNGKITAKDSGVCYIYAKANGKTAKCKVRVYETSILKNDFYVTGSFVLYDVGSSEAYDIFESLNDSSSSCAWSIYSTADKKYLGCSLSSVVKTRRGIVLGASKSDVLRAYGSTSSYTVSSSDGVYHVAMVAASRSKWDKATYTTMKKAKTCLAYTYSRNSSYSIRFYFNSSNKLIAIAYTKGYSRMSSVSSVTNY